MGLLGRGGPAPSWRARSLEAGLLRLRAAHARTCPHVGKWGGGGSPSLVTRHTRVVRGRAPTCGWAATARLAIAHAALRMRMPARTQLRTRERAQAGLARGLCRAPRIAHAAAGGAREARARHGGAGCTRIGPGARAAPHTQPHSRPCRARARSRALSRSSRVLPATRLRSPVSCRPSWFVSRGRLSGEGGSCSYGAPPSCLLPLPPAWSLPSCWVYPIPSPITAPPTRTPRGLSARGVPAQARRA